jgi:hypothetical protein
MADQERTDRFLAAGIRLLAKGLGLGDEDQPSTIFGWLSDNKVVAEAQTEGPLLDGKLPTKDMLRWQWKHHADYLRALISHIMDLYHWDWHTDIMDESALLLVDENDRDESSLVKAIKIVCYSNLKALIDNPVQRIMPIATVMISKDPRSLEDRARLYEKVSEQWTELFDATFDAHNINLRPGVDVQDAADILTALADGLAMRQTGDPNAQVIDRRTGDSLLGKAAMMMLLAGTDPGDHLTLEKALRQVVNKSISDPD